MKTRIRLLVIAAILLQVEAAPLAASTVTKLIPAGTLNPFWTEQKKGPGSIGVPGSETIMISSFRAQTTAVTNADFTQFLKENSKWQKQKVSPLFADAAYLAQFDPQSAALKAGHQAQAPVTYVSWFAAKAFCESKGMRLPTTAEWEYMAAASEKSKDASKDPEFLARILEWYAQPQETLPVVGSGYTNIYGLKEMHGMIWEWVDDFNTNLVTGESREDGSFNRDLFCGAGNLAGGNKENYAAFMRFAFRASLKGTSSIWNLGFRCVQEVQL